MSAARPDDEAYAALLETAMRGDPQSFATLCERHRQRVWRIVASIASGAEAEDLAQEAVVRAYAARRTYRAAASFEAWLSRIAVNVAHDYQRSAWQRRVTLCDQVPERNGEEAESTEGLAERRELQRQVRRAVAALPSPQRGPIWLRYFEGFSLAEIARLEGASESTIRSRVRSGLHRLSLSLDDVIESPAGPLKWSSETKGCEA